MKDKKIIGEMWCRRKFKKKIIMCPEEDYKVQRSRLDFFGHLYFLPKLTKFGWEDKKMK